MGNFKLPGPPPPLVMLQKKRVKHGQNCAKRAKKHPFLAQTLPPRIEKTVTTLKAFLICYYILYWLTTKDILSKIRHLTNNHLFINTDKLLTNVTFCNLNYVYYWPLEQSHIIIQIDVCTIGLHEIGSMTPNFSSMCIVNNLQHVKQV